MKSNAIAKTPVAVRHPWREQLQRLQPLNLPLLAIGAGTDCKQPASPSTGTPIAGWPTARHTIEQLQNACAKVCSVGTRTGSDAGGLLAFDIDGATALALACERRCDPKLASTWQIHRDNDPNRLKVCWRLSPEQQSQLGEVRPKITTKAPAKAEDGTVIAKGEALELFHKGGAQIIVLGQHPSSGGNYIWPEALGPEALAPIPPAWWDLALEVASSATKASSKTTGKASSKRGDWRSLDPCPICGRNTTGFCSIHADGQTLRCFQGSTFHPPIGLRPGDEITDRNGKVWAFSKKEPQADGHIFSVFVEPEPERTRQRLEDEWQEAIEGFEVHEGGYCCAEAKQKQHDRSNVGHVPHLPKQQRREPKQPRLPGYSRRMEWFTRCVEVQAQQQRNTFRRRARLLKAAQDLKLSKLINRQEIAQLVLEAKDRQAGHRFQPLTAAERLAMAVPDVEWVIPDVIPARDLTILGGRPKVGKTRLMAAMVASVLTGESFLGFPAPTRPRPVLLITDDQSDADTKKMLTTLGVWDHPLLTWSRHFRLCESDLDAMLATIKATPEAVVMTDSLRSITRSCSATENDPELGAMVYDLKQSVIDASSSLVLVHHCNKSTEGVGTEALSGHSSLAGAVNTVMTLHYTPDANGKPDKENHQRRLFSEGRSGPGFDLVISPIAGEGNYYRVGTFAAWREQLEEAKKQKNRERMTPTQHEVLSLLEDRAGEWLTRRQIVEALGLPWEQGRGKDATRVKDALSKLAQQEQIQKVSAGQEQTYSVGEVRDFLACTQKETSPSSPSSPFCQGNGSHGEVFENQNLSFLSAPTTPPTEPGEGRGRRDSDLSVKTPGSTEGRGRRGGRGAETPPAESAPLLGLPDWADQLAMLQLQHPNETAYKLANLLAAAGTVTTPARVREVLALLDQRDQDLEPDIA
ncbi:MAG: AAA family ATPase [Cyanobacteriota bacterium]|nr:AAA family ATPase [Cyanobacteriota bacterium]